MNVDSENTELITLKEFKALTGFSSEDLINILDQGSLPIVQTSDGLVMVNVDQVNLTDLIVSSIPQEKPLESGIEEIIASEILANMQSLIDEAVSLVKIWTKPED